MKRSDVSSLCDAFSSARAAAGAGFFGFGKLEFDSPSPARLAGSSGAGAGPGGEGFVSKLFKLLIGGSTWSSLWALVVLSKDYCIAQGYGEIDELPKAINSLCFISHDQNALLKDATPLEWELLPETPAPIRRPTTAPTHQEKPNADTMQEILSFIDADDYEIWIGIGMGLYREGYDFDGTIGARNQGSTESNR